MINIRSLLKLKRRFFKLISRCLLSVILVSFVWHGTVLADSLISPNFEIDALGFIPSDVGGNPNSISIIDGPFVTSVTGVSAVVQWLTDNSSSSFVAFGITGAYGTEIGQSEDRVKDHTVRLVGLVPSTTYHYQAKSIDPYGNIAKSADFTFTTTKQSNISEVQISDIGLNSAIITWKTTTVTSSTILYGKTTDYGLTFNDESSGFTTAHTIRLASLDSGSNYHFQITGQDSVGQRIVSDDYLFTTLTLPSITSYTLGEITGSTAVISWLTNIPTDSFVSFWPSNKTETDAITQGSPELATKHSVILTGLNGKTQYNFRILSRDTHGFKTQTNQLSFLTPVRLTPPVITDVKSEINTSAKNDRLQLVVSWNTDEPANSQIEYSVGVVSNQVYKSQSPVDPVMVANHITIVNNLTASTNYHFRIKSVDSNNNIGYSNDYSILTPQQQKSLLQIILEKLEQTFGWLRNVKIGGG